VLSSEVEVPYLDTQNSGARQRCTFPFSSTNAYPFPDPFTISDDLGKSSYAQEAGEGDGSLSVGPGGAGSDQFVTGSLQHSERRTAEPLPLFDHTDDSI
jgi:hypothetical protein